MIKKRILAGLLTVCMTLTSCSSVFPERNSSVEMQNTDSVISSSETDVSMHAENSLGKYIQKLSEGKSDSTALSESDMAQIPFTINNFEVDIDAGVGRVFSTQPVACKVRITVLRDDESELECFRISADAMAGDDISTEIQISRSLLPEYFIIKAELTDIADHSLCEPFYYNFYSYKTTQVREAVPSDFDEEKVVQLDENYDTNFVVLNESVVVAESAEDQNELLSADYDTGEYIFENADKTLVGLKKGDHFFIQADPVNLIAITVDDIEDHDGIVTIKEAKDTDMSDIFDLIKIECNDFSDEPIIEYDGSEYEFRSSFNSVDNKEEITYFKNDQNVMSKEKENVAEDESIYILPTNYTTLVDAEIKSTEIENFYISGHFTLGLAANINLYTENRYFDFYCVISPKTYLDISLKYSEGYTSDSSITHGKVEVKRKEIPAFKFGKIEIPTPIVLLRILIEPKVNISLDCELTFRIEESMTFGFVYTDDRFEAGKKDDEKVGSYYHSIYHKAKGLEDNTSFYLCGSAFIGLDLGPTVIFGNKKTLSVDLNAVVGFEALANLDIGVSSSDVVQHECEKCVDGNFNFVFKLGFTLHYLEWLFEEKGVTSIGILDIHLKLGDFYCCLTHKKFKLGTCPYKKYKTEIRVKIDGEPFENASVLIDNISLRKTTDENGSAVFYLVNSEEEFPYSYRVFNEKGEQVYCSDNNYRFHVHNDTKIITVNLPSLDEPDREVSTDTINEKIKEDAEKDIEPGKGYSEGEPLKIEDSGHIAVENKQIGDHIQYSIYQNGELVITGYGDMYNNIGRIVNSENKKLVTKVIFNEIYVDDIINKKTEVLDEEKEKNIEYDKYHITNIGTNLFEGCVNLPEIDLPDTIKSIGNSAFRNCSLLSEIDLPESLESIGRIAFDGCSGLKEVKIHDKIEVIESEAFRGCTGISEIYIPDSITRIENYAFRNCTALKKADICSGAMPDAENICTFGINIFNECYELEEMTLGGNIKIDFNCYIKDIFINTRDDELDEKYQLRKITYKNAEEINFRMFSGLVNLEDLSLPETLKKIGDYAMYKCYNLSDVTIPASVTEIGNGAFKDCVKISHIEIPEYTEKIGAFAFNGCKSLEGEIKIPYSTKYVGEYAFAGCDRIEKAEICVGANPESEEACIVSVNAFNQCFGITDLIIGGNIKILDNNVEYEIQSRVKNLFYYARENELDKKYSLKNIVYTNASEITDSMFIGLVNLENISFPNTVTVIGADAFRQCENMTDVYYDGSNKEWENVVINNGNNSLLNASIHFKSVIIIYGTEETDPDILEPFRGCGDLDNDGVTDITDLSVLSLYLVKDADLTQGGMVYADINQDGEVDISDLATLKMILMHAF